MTTAFIIGFLLASLWLPVVLIGWLIRDAFGKSLDVGD